MRGYENIRSVTHVLLNSLFDRTFTFVRGIGSIRAIANFRFNSDVVSTDSRVLLMAQLLSNGYEQHTAPAELVHRNLFRPSHKRGPRRAASIISDKIESEAVSTNCHRLQNLCHKIWEPLSQKPVYLLLIWFRFGRKNNSYLGINIYLAINIRSVSLNRTTSCCTVIFLA